MKNGLFKIEDAEEYEFSRVYYVKNHFSVTRERKLNLTNYVLETIFTIGKKYTI